MKNLNKKITSLLLVIAVILTATSIPVVSAVTKNLEDSSATVETQASANSYGLADNVQDGQILQCFNWSFSAIKSNIKKIAEQGFTAVQTSPIQTAKESTAGKSAKGSWWVLYQPVGFNIETNAHGSSALGTASDFKAMCDEAHKYGVKVIVDAVLNHMGNQSRNDLSSSIPSEIRNDRSLWHDISKNSWYASRHDITQYCMDGVPDLNTGNTKVQNYAISFLKECIDKGADGFRFDGAKHIEVPVDSGFGSNFWPNVLNTTTSYAKSTRGITPFYYGEVLDKATGNDDQGNGQNVVNSYTSMMSITLSSVSNGIRGSVNSGNASGAIRSDFRLDDGSTAKGSRSVLWNESHDTYQAGGSSGVSNDKINKTWALVGSRAEACGMYLARPNNWGSVQMGQGDVTAWANKEVQAVNKFKNAMIGESEYLSSSGSIAYNERGTKGVVLVNCSGGQQQVSVQAHKMQSGTYKDVISGNTFTVSGGKISGQIGSTGIAVVYSSTPKPANTISQAGGNFKTDTLTLTLGLENATSGTYQIGSDSAKTYTGTTSVTIGAGVSYGSTITVKLTATGEGGTTNTSYTFKKVDPNAVRIIDFSNDHTVYLWNTAKWSNQYCYSWPTGGDGATAWPGSTMTKVDTFGGYDLYKFTIPASDSNIIFNNGSGDNGKTDDLTLPTEMKVYDNSKNAWVDANSIDEDVLASRGGDTSSSSPQPSTGSGQTYLYGDVDLSGAINVKDATLVQKVAANSATINTVQTKAADVNGDGFVDVRDATLIQKFAANTVNSFTVGVSFTDGGNVTTGSKPTTSSSTLPPSNVTITIKDSTEQGWLGDADALFILVDTSSNKEYQMTNTGDGWQVSVPASVTNIKFNRNNPNSTSETWNSWDAGNRGSSTTYVATSSGTGNWS